MVAFAVGFVALRGVTDQIAQGEAIVSGDVVEAGLRRAAARGEEVAASRESGRQASREACVSPPEPPGVVAEAAVPFGPARRESPELVPVPRIEIPRLGDELDPLQRWVLLDCREQRSVGVEVPLAPSERRGQIEPEAIDPHLLDPVPEAVEHEPHDRSVMGVERVSAARAVHVPAPVRRIEAIVGRVVDAPERERRAVVAEFPRVVVDDIENDLDPCFMEPAHHVAELAHYCQAGCAGGVGRLRREVGQGLVTPVIRQPLPFQARLAEVVLDR